jgi:ribosomal protein S18 acetylase RimI-like enzyme
MRDYQRAIGVDLCFQGFEDELRALPGDYAPPRGALILARHGGLPAGCVALRPWDDAACEMKRLYVRAPLQGQGLGRLLVDTVIARALALGYRAIRLDTLPMMATAIALYERYGFREIAPYRDNPIEGARYMEKRLA